MDTKNRIYEYNRWKAVAYARKWALKRNLRFGDFHDMGGDCTNFASQVIYAGGCPMNHYKYGWYYKSLNNRAPAWTSVEYLYQFLINNKSSGPIGEEIDLDGLEIGDLVQLSFEKGKAYEHTPVVIDILTGMRDYNKIIIAAHSIDRIDYPLSQYDFKKIRCIHVKGYRK